ncbi:hypothetical protein F2Q69_00021646 [Brassica cretica]|uniref:NAC domain-containing protein n=1 Tax=Brassica cretica TaxID=69181 RepID=A0A8S9QE06_BRACR|nr:hypothetical protein F2Q69_00021646 [Brassica cretica]
MFLVKSGSAVGFGLSRWLGRSRTGSVRLVFRTWTWSKLHSGCKWIETVHSPIGLSDLIGRMNLNWDVWSVLISLVLGLGHISWYQFALVTTITISRCLLSSSRILPVVNQRRITLHQFVSRQSQRRRRKDPKSNLGTPSMALMLARSHENDFAFQALETVDEALVTFCGVFDGWSFRSSCCLSDRYIVCEVAVFLSCLRYIESSTMPMMDKVALLVFAFFTELCRVSKDQRKRASADLSVVGTTDSEWLFFCPLDRKYPSGNRMNGATVAGYWKVAEKTVRLSQGALRS